MSSRVYKIALFGGGCVGKSAVVIRSLKGIFAEAFDPTIEDSYTMEIEVDGRQYKLDITDTSGSEEASLIWDSYIKDNQGYVLVYSIASDISFKEAKDYYERIIRVKGADDFSIVLVGNKCDLEGERQVTTEQGEELARNLNCPFFEASAKDGTHVDDAFTEIVREITSRNPPEPEPEHEPAEEKSKGGKFFKFFKRK